MFSVFIFKVILYRQLSFFFIYHLFTI